MKLTNIFAFMLGVSVLLASCKGTTSETDKIDDVSSDSGAAFEIIDSTDELEPSVTEPIEETVHHREPLYSEDSVTVYCEEDLGKLGINDENIVFGIMKAIVTLDVSKLERLLRLDEGVLKSFESLAVDEFSVTRSDVDSEFVTELCGYISITESEVDRLPIGKYRVYVNEGYYYPEVEFFNIESMAPYEPQIRSDEYAFLTHMLHTFGAADYEMISKGGEEVCNSIKWQYLFDECESVEGADGGMYYDASYEDFLEYAAEVFGVDASGCIAREEIEKQYVLYGWNCAPIFSITDEVRDSNITKLTVELYAEPMKIIVAKRYEFKLSNENGVVKFIDADCIFDSGFEALEDNYYC